MTQSELPLPVHIIRSEKRHKTIAIEVRSDEIVVRAPVTTPTSRIEALLDERQAWIQKIWDRRAESPKSDGNFLSVGVWYLGELLSVNYVNREQRVWQIERKGSELHIAGPVVSESTDDIRNALYAWYRGEATRILKKQLRALAIENQVEIKDVRIKDQKTRWGSCSSQRNINLNWRLIMAPPWVARYVMIHELCHVREMNHSDKFWSEVRRAMPNYEEARDWLRENGHLLAW